MLSSLLPPVAHFFRTRLQLELSAGLPQSVKPALLLAIGCLAATNVAWSQSAPQKLADLNSTPAFETFSGATVAELADGRLVLYGTDAPHGTEVWVTDRTPGGTMLLKDIFPGPHNSDPRSFVSAGGLVYFTATSLEHGRELWSTDGTTANTQIVEDFWPGTGSGDPTFVVESGGSLFFRCRRPDVGLELCFFDGTTVSTLDLVFGSEGSNPVSLASVLPGTVCFSATTEATGAEPWCSDGTVAGTDLVAEVQSGPDGSFPSQFTHAGSDKVLFRAWGTQGIELYRLDISSGSLNSYDLNPGSSHSWPTSLLATSTGVFFAADEEGFGMEVFFHDSATGSNTRIVDLKPGASGGASRNAGQYALIGDTFIFAGDDGVHGEELWATEGTAATTVMIADVNTSGSSSPENLGVASGAIFFSATDGTGDTQLWAADPDGSGHFEIFDFGPSAQLPRLAFDASTEILMFASPNTSSEQSLFLLGEDSGTFTMEQITPNSVTTASRPTSLTTTERGIVFRAEHNGLGGEPWELVPGSPPEFLGEMDLGAGGVSFLKVASTASHLLLKANSSTPDEPYLWDGSTLQRVDLRATGDSDPGDPVTVGETFLLTARPNTGGDVTFGIDPLGSVEEFSFFGVPFAGGDVALLVEGGDLHVSDGTISGTTLVGSFPTPISVKTIREQTADVPLMAVFKADSELWVTDGSVVGTQMVLADFPGSTQSSSVVLNDRLLLKGDVDGVSELHVTDGTAPGSAQVTQRGADPRYDEGDPSLLGTVPNGWLYRDRRSDIGSELFFTDGVNPPVALDIWPGVSSSSPEAGARLGDLYYFIARTADRGEELWSTDGTLAGTLPVAELHPGPASEDLRYLAAKDGALYISAQGPGEDGAELWIWALPLFSDGFESGTTAEWN